MKELVRKWRDGDLEAFTALVANFQSMVFGTAHTLVGNVHDAQDIAQEAFLQAWRDRGYLTDDERFPAWLHRIVRNRSYDFLRARSSQPLAMEDTAEPSAPGALPDERAERGEISDAVRDALIHLSEPNRLATTLYYLGGHTIDEVAAFLDIPPGTVKRRLHESRKQLKERMIGMVEAHLRENGPKEDFGHEVKERIDEWRNGMDAANRSHESELAADAEALTAFEVAAGDIPEWARSVAEVLPDWGFEPCGHRWLDGLDEVIAMIGSETCHTSMAGRCGDMPGYVRNAAERRISAVESWIAGAQPEGAIGEQVATWLGSPSVEKHEAARCLVAIMRAFLYRAHEEAQEVAKEWREKTPDTEVFRWLFLGDGIIGMAENGCGYTFLDRLDTVIRIIGGAYDEAINVYYSCNTTLQFAMRKDPDRILVTRGYLWGLHAYLAGYDEDRLRADHPECAGAAIHALRGVAGSEATPVRRWVVAAFFRSLKWWYFRTLSMMHSEDSVDMLEDIPKLEGVPVRG